MVAAVLGRRVQDLRGMTVHTTFENYLSDLPLLHTWDEGKTWNTGGFNADQLRTVHGLVTQRFPTGARIIETGAGNSTLSFLFGKPASLVSIAPAADLRSRIVDQCARLGLDAGPLDFRVARSEVELPPLALAQPKARFDVALIDGGHGWPTVFVDFCYLNMMLGAGSLLLVDDTQLHSVAELSRLLEMQDGFSLIEQRGKLQIWTKDDGQPFLPEHSREPYIIKMTDAAREASRGQPKH